MLNLLRVYYILINFFMLAHFLLKINFVKNMILTVTRNICIYLKQAYTITKFVSYLSQVLKS